MEWRSVVECGGVWNQEQIEPAKPAREHVTTIDSEIQTWQPDTNFSNIQIWKGSNMCMHTCIRRVPDTVQE